VHQDLRESLDHLNFENHKETGTGDHGVVNVRFKFNPA
jgi:hypothetical protein